MVSVSAQEKTAWMFQNIQAHTHIFQLFNSAQPIKTWI